jgi:hypothetical protein
MRGKGVLLAGNPANIFYRRQKLSLAKRFLFTEENLFV